MGPKDPRNALESSSESTAYELLTTKLSPPRLRPLIVPRHALCARLDKGLEHKLTLISAPAGFGKTTLVCEWINLRRELGDLPPLAWVALDDGDNDTVRFWRYVFTACNGFAEGISSSALAVLNASPRPPIQTLLTMFINQAARLPSKAVLVLEDYHAIIETQIHNGLNFALDHLPPAIHVILITRGDPPLPLARLRARDELNELRADDLRFSISEVQAFLEKNLQLNLSGERVARLASRTEGWAAGLRLVALALQRRGAAENIDQFLDTFTGSHRPVLDYLIGDVFSAQPEPLQQFLLKTSILSRLTGSLCNAITGRDDSAQILERLVHDNLFLDSLDASHQWYRFHALFAEAMQHYAQLQLGEPKLYDLAGMASLWYEQHGLLAEAVEVSLFAKDFRRAAGLIGRIIAPRLVQNEHQTLRRWMDQIPEQVLAENPEICLPYATAILFTSDMHAPETKDHLLLPLQIAEKHWQREKSEPKLGEVLAFHALVEWQQREYRESTSFARQALIHLPASDRQWRGISLIFVGVDEMLRGKLFAARQTLTEALILSEAAGNSYAIIDTMLLIGELCFLMGELRQAAQTFQQILNSLEGIPMERDHASMRRGRALLGMSMPSLEWNDLEAAETAAAQAFDIGKQYPEEDWLVYSPVTLAQVKYARGESALAQELLGSLLAQPTPPLLFRFPRVNLARYALARGDLDAVEHWASTDALPGDDVMPIQLEQTALVVARLRILQGDARAAIKLLESWLPDAQDNGRARSRLEIQIILAQAHAALGDRSQARQWLIQALALAQPEGYLRIFLDEGDRLAVLLRDLQPEFREEPLASYARALVYTMSQEQSRKSAESQETSVLIEPLSEQEQRVLRLLAAGLSNLEIAEELVISINTVKTHVKNVYKKLNINSRSEARQAARHLRQF